MSLRLFFISVTVSVLLFCASVRAQEPVSIQESDETRAEAVRKKAIKLLESVAGEVASLRSPENRARIGSNVADLLWNHDEQRSRSIFVAVKEDIREGLNDTDPDEAAHVHTLLVFERLRSDILGRIATHDPDFALEFLRSTRPPSGTQTPYEMKDSEKLLELRLARQISAKNPQLGLKLGRESLAKGFSNELLPILSQLQQKDKETALIFYKAILEKLKSANLARDPTATELALTLTRSFQPPEADEQIYREIVGILVASASANGCPEASSDYPPQICYEIGTSFSSIVKYYPASASRMKRWASDAQINDPGEFFIQINDIFEKGSVDEILALAGKYPELNPQIYSGAVSRALAAGDFARARSIATDFPGNAEQRDQMLADINTDEKRMTMGEEQMAELQQTLTIFRHPQDRIQFLLQIAGRVGSRDPKPALALLSQAEQLLLTSKPGTAETEAQIQLALLYCFVKTDRGFAIMESLIPRLNALVAAAATLDGFENSYLRDGEWAMTGAGSVGSILTLLAQTAGHFAWRDFDRSVTLAQQFERPELRLMAELKIAQSVLTNPPNANTRAQLR